MSKAPCQCSNHAGLPADFEIEISSLLIEETGRIFSIIKRAETELFLTSTIGWNKRKHWSKNFKRAALFPDDSIAKTFADGKFKNVRT